MIEEGDTLAVFHKENAGKAYTTGIALNTEFSITPNWAFLGNLRVGSETAVAVMGGVGGKNQIASLTVCFREKMLDGLYGLQLHW